MLHTLLQRQADRQPGRAAIRCEGQEVTYAGLCARAAEAARGLEAEGVGPGDMVATCCDNDIDNLVVLLALARLGARVATLDVASTAHELAPLCADCRPRLVLCAPSVLPKLREAASALQAPPRLLPAPELPRLRGEAPLGREPRAGPFLVQYTSGSTGKPKGVVQSQRGLVHRLESWAATASFGPEDRHLCILPLSHGYGSYCVALPALASGGTLHLMEPAKATPHRVLQHLQAHRITCFYALPYFYQLLATVPAGVQADLSGLRIALCGSAPLAASTAAAFRARYGVALNDTYGTSEAGIITSRLEPDAPEGTVGRLILGMEAKLVGGTPGGAEDTGELAVRTPSLAEGYGSPEDGPLLRDGWSHTGDIVRRDTRGYFFPLGRVSQFINVNGNKVMPAEVEAVIQQVEGVRESAVIGVDDPRTGQRVAAFVVADPGVSEARIQEHCRARLAGFKVPQHLRFLQELPKTPVGKVQKSRLRLEETP